MQVAATNRQVALLLVPQISFRACKVSAGPKIHAVAGCTVRRVARRLDSRPAQKYFRRRGVVRVKRYGTQRGTDSATGLRSVYGRESGRLHEARKI